MSETRERMRVSSFVRTATGQGVHLRGKYGKTSCGFVYSKNADLGEVLSCLRCKRRLK